MKPSKASPTDHQVLRKALSDLQPGDAHQANDPPDPRTIFAPTAHVNALDPQRPLVVGNRGVGKSFWSSVLTHDESRTTVAPVYARLRLTHIRAVLGFHEAAGKDDGPSPSPIALKSLLEQGHESETIWRAVLMQALHEDTGTTLPSSLKDIIAWMKSDIGRMEAALRHADGRFVDKGEIFLLVFDALDRLGTDWQVITPLTVGILRLALDMRGFRAMRAKVFMRTDQSKNDPLFRFPDASKIRSNPVNLVWKQSELFGLLYKNLLARDDAGEALSRLAGYEIPRDLGNELLHDEAMQEELFYRLAGEFMGSSLKRGRTYNWLYNHLADTFGETSPRSFITAVQRAAAFHPSPKGTVFDHNGIRDGVRDASRVRVDQLKEDYGWIRKAMGALDGLEVPCAPSTFKSRWTIRKTVTELETEAADGSCLLPLELVTAQDDPEEALLQALRNIGVIEFRTEKRINMPDIFRVEAGIKRRGGMRPPTSRRT